MDKPKRKIRRAWSKEDEKALRAHSRSKTPITKVSRAMRRTQGALRQKAFGMRISLGHRNKRR